MFPYCFSLCGILIIQCSFIHSSFEHLQFTPHTLPLPAMPSDILTTAIQTIRSEAGSIEALAAFISDDFVKTVTAIHESKGRLIVSGIGKSAIVAQKIVATFNSTGTPALFMHAADAIHGDMGMIQPDDMVMILSNSGNSPEIKALVPLIRSFGNKLIGMVAIHNLTWLPAPILW
jgi:arabinose-5-phosphate isomerase